MERRRETAVGLPMDGMDHPSVLVVDDEPNVALVLQLSLQHEGFATYQARDGIEALEQIQLHHPALMVLDVMMPRMDGWTVLQELAKLPFEERPRVVMVTALATRDDREKAVALGADAYVPKPFDLGELIGVLEGLALAS